MTLREVSMQVLRDWGIRTTEPSSNLDTSARRGVSPGDLQSVVVHLNGAIQEAFRHAPAAICERPLAGVLRAQTSVTVTVTQFDSAISLFAGYEPWMDGCTIRISGDSADNEVDGNASLVRPYMGATGVQSALVWGDCIKLEADTSHVLEPLTLPGYWILSASSTREEILLAAAINAVRTPHDRPQGYGTPTINKRTGQPWTWFADTRYDARAAHLPVYLRVGPMPAQNYPIQGRRKLLPPVFTVEDIEDGDHNTDPQTVIPMSWNESVILPYARVRGMGDPMFSNDSGRTEIQRQYQAARAMLESQPPSIGPVIARYR